MSVYLSAMIYNHLVIRKRYFRDVLDGIFVLCSYVGAYFLLYPSDLIHLAVAKPTEAALAAGVIVCVQMAIFRASGLYKNTILHLGIAGIVMILKIIGLSVIATAFVHYFFYNDLLQSGLLLFIIDFYFLVTLVLGMRISFHVLKYLFERSRSNQQRILIYGAGEQGVFALQQIQSMAPQKYTTVGFIDEDPELEGKSVNGYPVFGGHWKLERVVRTKKIDKLLITESQLHPKVVRELQAIAKRHHLDIQLIHVQIKGLELRSPGTGAINTQITYLN